MVGRAFAFPFPLPRRNTPATVLRVAGKEGAQAQQALLQVGRRSELLLVFIICVAC